jgi:hypothetical protein
MLSPYDILDIQPDATTNEIKSRYRQLVLNFHPDKNKTVSPEYFLEIQKAYKEIIGNRRSEFMPEETIDYIDTESLEIDSCIRDMFDFENIDDNNFKIDFSSSDKEAFEDFVKNFNSRFEEVHEKFQEVYKVDKGDASFTPEIKDNTIGSMNYEPLTNVNYKKDFTEPENDVICVANEDKSLLSQSDEGHLSKVFNQPLYINKYNEEKNKTFKSVNDLLKEEEERRNDEQRRAEINKEDIKQKFEENEILLKAMKVNQESIFQKEKSTFNSLWNKALDFKKQLLKF